MKQNSAEQQTEARQKTGNVNTLNQAEHEEYSNDRVQLIIPEASSSINTHSKLSTFEKVLAFAFRQTPIPSGKKEFYQQLIQFLASINVLSYHFPTKKYCDRNDSLLLSHLTIIVDPAVLLAAGVVLYNATDDFFKIRFSKNVREQFYQKRKNQIDKNNSSCWKNCNLELIGIITASALSSIVLAVVIIPYDNGLSKSLTYCIIGSSFFSNTVLHFLPFQQLADDWKFLSPIYWSKRLLHRMTTTKNERIFDKEKKEWFDRCKTLKGKLTQSIDQYFIQLQAKHFTFNWKRLRYDYTFPDEFDDLSLQDDASIQRIWGKIINAPKTQEKTKSILHTLFRVFFLIEVPGSCLGYLANPIVLANKWLKNPYATAALVGVPVYALTILLCYFGIQIGNSFFNSFCHKNSNTIPMIVKLYFPIFLWIVTPVMAYVGFFSYAAAEQLFDDNLGPLFTVLFLAIIEKALSYLVIILGITILDDYAIYTFSKKASMKHALYIAPDGSEQKKWASLSKIFETAKTLIATMPEEKFTQGIESLTKTQCQTLFQADKEIILELIKKPEEKQTSEPEYSCIRSVGDCLTKACCFFTKRRRGQRKYEPIQGTKLADSSSSKRNPSLENMRGLQDTAIDLSVSDSHHSDHSDTNAQL
jgi:hypothetical protein